jgi:HEAT repeat protein
MSDELNQEPDVSVAAVAVAIQQLADLNDDRQTEAITLLSRMGSVAIPALIAALSDRERWFPAASALAIIGPPAIQPLIDVMRQRPLGNFAFHALTLMGEQAMPAFLTALSDPDPEVRMWAASAFVEAPTPIAYTALMTATTDPDRLVRQTAIEALGKLQNVEALTRLRQIRNDATEDEQVRNAARVAIQDIQGRDSQ